MTDTTTDESGIRQAISAWVEAESPGSIVTAYVACVVAVSIDQPSHVALGLAAMLHDQAQVGARLTDEGDQE